MSQSSDLPVRKPSWLKTPLPKGDTFFEIKRDLRKKNLFTVCEEAKCPNLGECWATNTATFMVLGDVCTRACRFCHIKTGNPNGWLDDEEPKNVADSCEIMKLDYVVITMVDRDDLEDGGAKHLSRVVSEILVKRPSAHVEVLSGDFVGRSEPLEELLRSGLKVFAHNIETVKRLSPRVRDARANYERSLNVLKNAREISSNAVATKSALMLGLGESFEEVCEAMDDLRSHGVEMLTIGQYMRPTKKHLSIKEYIHPDVFDQLKEEALNRGFLSVASGPLVRSSYRASDFYDEYLKAKKIVHSKQSEQ